MSKGLHASIQARSVQELPQVIRFLEREFKGMASVGPATANALPGICPYSTFNAIVHTAGKTMDQVGKDVDAALQNLAADILTWRDQLSRVGHGLELVWRFPSKITITYNVKDALVAIRTRLAITTAEDRELVMGAGGAGGEGLHIIDPPRARLYADAEIQRIRDGAVATGRILERECWLKVPLTPFHIHRDQWILRTWRRLVAR